MHSKVCLTFGLIIRQVILISKDVMFRIGYVYSYWYFMTQEESKKIYKQAPFETMNGL